MFHCQLILALILILCIHTVPAVGDDFSKEVIQATAISSSLFMLEGAGGNMAALLSAEGVLLVDDDFAPMADKLLAKLKELKGASPRYIVNTHFHYDHTGGNEVFGSTATILAASAVRDRLMTEQDLWRSKHPAVPLRALPLLTFDEALTLHLDDEEVRVVHLPHGHTDGDSVVFFKNAKVVCLGDLYFSGMYPIFHPEHGGSLEGYIKNIATVLEQISDEIKIVPGHGPLATKADLKKYQQMILASVAIVRAGIKNSHSLAQIQKAGLDKKWESFSHGYLNTDQWLALIYKALAKEEVK